MDDREWFMKKSKEEDNGFICVGGLVTAARKSGPPLETPKGEPIRSVPETRDMIAGKFGVNPQDPAPNCKCVGPDEILFISPDGKKFVAKVREFKE